MPGLNPDQDDPAYLAGRLWAVFAALEMAATGDDDVAVAKMPAAVNNPPLTPKLVDNHVGPLAARLARVDPAAAEAVTALLTELGDRIAAGTWSGGRQADQWMFTLGFHHQRPRAQVVAGVYIDTAEVAKRHFDGKLDAARQQIKRWIDADQLTDGYELDGRKWWWAYQIAVLAGDRRRPRGNVRPSARTDSRKP